MRCLKLCIERQCSDCRALCVSSFIRKGYRVDYSTRDTFRSLFRLHNETGNVWTHLCGMQRAASSAAAPVCMR